MSFQSPIPLLHDAALRRPSPAGRRLRVVVAGEFKSGKSSVINALLRRPVLPMQQRQVSCPAFLVRHAGAEAGSVLLHDGSGRSTPAPALDESTDFGGAGLCEVATEAAHLDGVELVELPFPCDGEVGPEAIALMAGADLLIWVSIASQAWRLSEKAILTRLPPMRGRSVIVLSRADKLRSAADWDRIEERVQREAGPWFSAVAFVQASRETIRASTTDDRAWETSGGKILAELVADRRRRVTPEVIARVVPAAMAAGVAGPRAPVAEPEAAIAPDLPPAAPVEPPRRAAEAGPLPVLHLVESAAVPSKAAVVAGIETVVASLGGLLCGGIARLADGASLAAIGPQRADAARLAPAVQAILASRGALAQATGAAMDEAAIRLGGNLLLAVPLADEETAAFLLLRNDATNIVLARTALRRIGGLWAEGS